MYMKAVLLVFAVALICQAKRLAPVGRLLNEVCNGTADTQQCRDVAVKCFPRRNRNSSASEWHDKVCTVLNGCLDTHNGTRIIYNTYVHVIHDDFDMCLPMNHTDDHNHDMIPHDHLHDHNHDHPLDHTHDHPPLDNNPDHAHDHAHDHDHNHGECIMFPPILRRRRRIGFEDYLAQVEGEAKANDFRCCESKGFGKFKSDGKVNVTAWKEDATRVEDPTAREALVKSIDTCAASEHSCSTHKFQLCIVSKCYEQIKPPKV